MVLICSIQFCIRIYTTTSPPPCSPPLSAVSLYKLSVTEHLDVVLRPGSHLELHWLNTPRKILVIAKPSPDVLRSLVQVAAWLLDPLRAMHVYVEPSVYARLGLVSRSPPQSHACLCGTQRLCKARLGKRQSRQPVQAVYTILPNQFALTPPALCLALPNPPLNIFLPDPTQPLSACPYPIATFCSTT